MKAIRRTAKQELLLQLRHAPDIKTKDLRTAVRNILGSNANVISREHLITLYIRDLDEVTTKADIYEALHVQCNIATPTSDQVNLRNGYRGTHVAYIKLSADVACINNNFGTRT